MTPGGPFRLDLAIGELNVEHQGEALDAFRVEVAWTCVTGDVITRLGVSHKTPAAAA